MGLIRFRIDEYYTAIGNGPLRRDYLMIAEARVYTTIMGSQLPVGEHELVVYVFSTVGVQNTPGLRSFYFETRITINVIY